MRYNALKLRVAIFLADSKHLAYNKRYYVLPATEKGKFNVWCNDDIKLLKRPIKKRYFDPEKKCYKYKKQSYIKKSYHHLELINDALYYTPSSIKKQDGCSEEKAILKKRQWLTYMSKQ